MVLESELSSFDVSVAKNAILNMRERTIHEAGIVYLIHDSCFPE